MTNLTPLLHFVPTDSSAIFYRFILRLIWLFSLETLLSLFILNQKTIFGNWDQISIPPSFSVLFIHFRHWWPGRTIHTDCLISSFIFFPLTSGSLILNSASAIQFFSFRMFFFLFLSTPTHSHTRRPLFPCFWQISAIRLFPYLFSFFLFPASDLPPLPSPFLNLVYNSLFSSLSACIGLFVRVNKTRFSRFSHERCLIRKDQHPRFLESVHKIKSKESRRTKRFNSLFAPKQLASFILIITQKMMKSFNKMVSSSWGSNYVQTLVQCTLVTEVSSWPWPVSFVRSSNLCAFPCECVLLGI